MKCPPFKEASRVVVLDSPNFWVFLRTEALEEVLGLVGETSITSCSSSNVPYRAYLSLFFFWPAPETLLDVRSCHRRAFYTSVSLVGRLRRIVRRCLLATRINSIWCLHVFSCYYDITTKMTWHVIFGHTDQLPCHSNWGFWSSIMWSHLNRE